MPSLEHQPELGIRCPCVACVIAKNRQETAERARVQRTGSIDPRPLAGHATRACYVRGCRRPECVEANRAYQRDRARERRPERPIKPTEERRPVGRPRNAPHGTVRCYWNGCRRPECTAAERSYRRDAYRRGRVAS